MRRPAQAQQEIGTLSQTLIAGRRPPTTLKRVDRYADQNENFVLVLGKSESRSEGQPRVPSLALRALNGGAPEIKGQSPWLVGFLRHLFSRKKYFEAGPLTRVACDPKPAAMVVHNL